MNEGQGVPASGTEATERWVSEGQRKRYMQQDQNHKESRMGCMSQNYIHGTGESVQCA